MAVSSSALFMLVVMLLLLVSTMACRKDLPCVVCSFAGCWSNDQHGRQEEKGQEEEAGDTPRSSRNFFMESLFN
jgi:hypothetical protein